MGDGDAGVAAAVVVDGGGDVCCSAVAARAAVAVSGDSVPGSRAPLLALDPVPQLPPLPAPRRKKPRCALGYSES